VTPKRPQRRSNVLLYVILWSCQLVGLLLVRFVFFANADYDTMYKIILVCFCIVHFGFGILAFFNESPSLSRYLSLHHRARYEEMNPFWWDADNRWRWARFMLSGEDLGDISVLNMKKNIWSLQILSLGSILEVVFFLSTLPPSCL
jgi:hypothetical protein